MSGSQTCPAHFLSHPFQVLPSLLSWAHELNQVRHTKCAGLRDRFENLWSRLYCVMQKKEKEKDFFSNILPVLWLYWRKAITHPIWLNQCCDVGVSSNRAVKSLTVLQGKIANKYLNYRRLCMLSWYRRRFSIENDKCGGTEFSESFFLSLFSSDWEYSL